MRLAHLFVKGGLLGYAGLRSILKVAFSPFYFGYTKVLRPLVLSTYLQLFSGKKIWRRFFKTSHNVWHNILNQRASLLVIIVLLALLSVTNNILARETLAEDLGKESILFELVAEETDVGIIEDTQLPKPTEVPVSATEGLAVSSDEEPSQQLPQENTLSVTSGGQAIVAISETATPHTRTEIEPYVVQPDDTATSIAKQFGVTINSILWANNLNAYSIIRPGDTIDILPVSGLLHTVAKGDTLSGIAKKYQTDEATIIEFNRIATQSLKIGAELIVPGGVPPAPKIIPPSPQPTLAQIFSPTPAPTDSGQKLFWPGQSHRINQYYNWRHRGLDINGNTGDPIYASEDGKVETSGWNNGGYGYYVIINHGNGIKTLYAHNSKNAVSVGDTVTRGQLIGYMGSTGRSTGPHIHYEVRVNGRTVNPLLYTK